MTHQIIQCDICRREIRSDSNDPEFNKFVKIHVESSTRSYTYLQGTIFRPIDFSICPACHSRLGFSFTKTVDAPTPTQTTAEQVYDMLYNLTQIFIQPNQE